MIQCIVIGASCKTEEEEEVCLSNSRSWEQWPHSPLCDFWDSITRPLHQECKQRYSNIPSIHCLPTLLLQAAKKNIHQLFSNYFLCSGPLIMVLLTVFIHPLTIVCFVLPNFCCVVAISLSLPSLCISYFVTIGLSWVWVCMCAESPTWVPGYPAYQQLISHCLPWGCLSYRLSWIFRFQLVAS